ncbi:hypothetical protein BH23GEM7_BH23GEM7_26080 [soil metagenome]|nr:VCBS repeat-containing protein [Gemmatimonadales bacterium]
MQMTRRTWFWSVVLLALLASCERHPLSEKVPEVGGEEEMVQGMTPQGPQAGPLSTEAPRILAPQSVSPVAEPSRSASGSLPPGMKAPRLAAPPASLLSSAAPLSAATTPRILWENTSSGQRVVWPMNGPNWGGESSLLPQVDPAWRIAGSGDFNGDAHADLVWQNLHTGQRVIWFMNDLAYSGQFADLGVVDPAWHIAAVADFNADGQPDLLWTHQSEGHRVIWFMNGTGYSGHAALPQVDPAWEIAGAADFNGDGQTDIVWQHGPSGQRVIWFMNGALFEGQFAALPTVDPSWVIVGVTDFDADGHPDILWQQLSTGWRAIWLMSGAVWNGIGTLLPIVASEWHIAGTLDAPEETILEGWVQISTGLHHTCAVNEAGQAYCWGRNQFGQLGDGTTELRSRPRLVAGGLVWASVTAGHNHTCGVTTAGDGFCWGNGADGRLGNSSTASRPTPQPIAVSGGDTWQILTAGERHTCGMTPDGRAYCWGHNFRGQLGDGTSTNRTTRVLVVDDHTWQVVSAGARHTCGVATTGDTYCWGERDSGRLGNGASGTAAVTRPNLVLGGHKWTHVAARSAHTCGITTSGESYCWGRNNAGQLGDGTTTLRTAPALILNNHVWAELKPGMSNTTCGVAPSGEAYCWGYNLRGQVGDGTTGNKTVPQLVSGGFTWTGPVSGGDEHTCGITNNGVAYCWGRGTYGQLGNGTTTSTNFPTPTRVASPQ